MHTLSVIPFHILVQQVYKNAGLTILNVNLYFLGRSKVLGLALALLARRRQLNIIDLIRSAHPGCLYGRSVRKAACAGT